ncbi:uncharacterized protein [Rutidosis leptorrhynchoides]|uniref:uncharacterized protein n=1 Tax=Rutidosis leptorrhynchoides TaxID=125765 RepID=UPI003A9A4946
MLSVSSALSILSGLKKYCGNQCLCPNELRAVIKVLEFICDEIEHQPNSDCSEWESSLVVPDDSCRLVDPHSCVYIDPRGSLYLEYIDSSKLRFVHHHVSERLCLSFGIKRLSDVVVAEEETLPIGSLLLCPPDSETSLADHIMKLSRDKKVMGLLDHF